MKYCKDYGDPYVGSFCLKEASEQYTMDFTNIRKGYIYWCANCGPRAKEMERLITEALETRGDVFKQEFKESVDNALKEQKNNAN